MNKYRIKSVAHLIMMFITLMLVTSTLTACESIEFLLEQNEKYKEEAKPEDLTNKVQEQSNIDNQLEVDYLSVGETNLADELIAADGLSINKELDYESYIGRDGQSIIDELFVVRRVSNKTYGDVLNYNGNKFYCDTEDICYAVYVKKDKALGIKFPAARTDLVALMGEPIKWDNNYQIYSYLDYVMQVPAANNEVKECIVAKDLEGLVQVMSRNNE